jgi:F-type H+-transporting ATPase subunit b
MEYQALHAIPWQHGSFWVAVAIIIFVVLFGKKIIVPITGMLDARTAAVRDALAEASALRAEAEALLADAKRRQEQAIAEAEQIREDAKAEAARTAAALAKEARAVTRRRERLALDRIAAAEKAALQEVRSVAIDIATTAASHMLRAGFAEDASLAMIDKSIAGVPAALKQAV